MDSTRSIGVFDSGVGGLTVLRELAIHFPTENFIYLGDTARLPYGTKSAKTIFNYSEQNIRFLLKKNVKAIIIACNSASSHFKDKEMDSVPIYNVIEPGAEIALMSSANKKIGVLGTKATVQSQSYVKAIHSLDESASVFQQPCPLLVPLAEEGWIDDPITNLIAFRYVNPLVQLNIDTLVLGCTHYPILKAAIQKTTGNSITLVDSGLALVKILQKELLLGKWKANEQNADLRTVELLATDRSEHFLKLAHEILAPITIQYFDTVDLSKES